LIKAGVHTGLGLMAASMIYMIDARGGCDPIQRFADANGKLEELAELEYRGSGIIFT